MGVPMRQDRPANPKAGDKIISYGHPITWTPLHKNAEELNSFVYTYDKLGTDAIDRLQEIAPPNKEGYHVQRDLFKLVEDNAHNGDAIGALWDEVNTVPEWVDWNQIERGQKVFWRYLAPMIVALTHLSLIGGFTYGRAVNILSKTGGWKVENTMRRLLETNQHTLDVHKDLKALQPGGEGWESSVRVRLLHSSVRRRVMNLAEEKPDFYDRDAHGVPINDMDSILAMDSFSSLVMYIGLPRQGIIPRKQEITDYVAMWRYICHIMGTPNWFLSSPEHGKAMMESIMIYEVKPDPVNSGLIANNMINGIVGQKPSYVSRGFLCAGTYWMNGKEIAKELQVEEPGIYYKTLFAAQCWLYFVTTTIRRLLPFTNDLLNKRSKEFMYETVVHNKEKGALGYKAKFTFKWIPAFDNVTKPADTPAAKRAISGAFASFGTESLALLTLVVTIASIASGLWYGARLAKDYGYCTCLAGFFVLAKLSAWISAIVDPAMS